MKYCKDIIALTKNKRGCYILDTIKGCNICNSEKPKGCYDNCYAKSIYDRYGLSFQAIKRQFYENNEQLCFSFYKDKEHEHKIIKEIENITMPFVRIGDMGDPSHDWEHTINICKSISVAKKKIVIITKHLNIIGINLLKEISRLGICINTSISALDSSMEIDYRLKQYNILKSYCNSVLRVVSCKFNISNKIGKDKQLIQNKLLNNEKVIETIFRVNNNNKLIKDNIIEIEKVKFLNSNILASINNKKTYFGYCGKCPDMCGI